MNRLTAEYQSHTSKRRTMTAGFTCSNDLLEIAKQKAGQKNLSLRGYLLGLILNDVQTALDSEQPPSAN